MMQIRKSFGASLFSVGSFRAGGVVVKLGFKAPLTERPLRPERVQFVWWNKDHGLLVTAVVCLRAPRVASGGGLSST